MLRASNAEAMSPIVQHPDVARMLMTMKALTAAARAICFMTADVDRPFAPGNRTGRSGLRRLAGLVADAGRQGVFHRHRQ